MSDYLSLTDSDARILAANHYAQRAMHCAPTNSPRFVLVGAQPGAGKTMVAQKIMGELRKQGGYIHVDADKMRLLVEDRGRNPTSDQTQSDAGKLVGLLRKAAIQDKRNIVEEGTFRNSNTAIPFIQARQAEGYQVELVAVATPKQESLLGIYQRYEQQIATGSSNPRSVPDTYHNEAFDGFLETFEKAKDTLARIRIVTRDGALCFDSQTPSINRHDDPLMALKEAQTPNADRLQSICNGWDHVQKMACQRGAPQDYVQTVAKHKLNAQADLLTKQMQDKGWPAVAVEKARLTLLAAQAPHTPVIEAPRTEKNSPQR